MNHFSNIFKYIFDSLKWVSFLVALIVTSAFMPSLACSQTRIEIDQRIQISHSYDDNIALEHKDAKSDQITTVSPQLLISWHAPQTDIEFEYAPSWVNYQTYTERNYLQHNGGLSFKHRLTEHTDFDFQDNFNTTDNFLDVPVVSNWHLPEARGIYYTNNTTAQLNHRFGQENRINAGYNYRFLINKDASLLSANRAAAPPDDTVRHGPFAKLNYQFNIRNSLVLEYRYVRNLYKRSDAVMSSQASDTASDDAEDDSEKDGSASTDDEEPEQEDAAAMDQIVIDRDIFNDDKVPDQEDASAMDNIVIDRDIFNDDASNQGDNTASDEENTDKELIVNDDASDQKEDTASDEENTRKELIVNDDASDQEDDTASAADEDAAPEPADEVASDRDFDDQTLTIGYIYRFDRHISSNIKQRIFIHRMVVSDRSSEDYQVYDTTVGLDYQISRHTGFSLEAGYSKQQGDSSHTSEGMLFNGSINHKLKHGGMSLAARNGWNADSPQESSLEEDTGEFTRYWGIEGNVNYQPWENVATNAGLFYRNDTGSSSTASETWQASCGADIGIATWLALSLNYNHQFRVEEQTDQTLAGDCTLNINALPWLVVGLNYQYSSSISDIPENQYVDNRFTINLSAARTQPYFWNF